MRTAEGPSGEAERPGSDLVTTAVGRMVRLGRRRMLETERWGGEAYVAWNADGRIRAAFCPQYAETLLLRARDARE